MKLDHWFILKEYRDSPGLAARIIRHVVAWSPIFSSSLIADKFEVDYPSLRRGVNADIATSLIVQAQSVVASKHSSWAFTYYKHDPQK